MKRFAYLLMLSACFILTACPSNQPENNGDDNATETTIETAEAESQLPTVEFQEKDLFFNELAHDFLVESTPNIESFTKSLPIYEKEYGFFNEEDAGEFVLDKKNGYFHYSFEGDGSVGYEAAYWNRTDGKKLFILSYHRTESDYAEGVVESSNEHLYTPWYYAYIESVGGDEETTYLYSHESGFAAYLYNEENHMLEMLPDPPFNGWQAKDVNHYLALPQNGKDIKVIDITGDEPVSTMLKWNGMTFDYQE